MPTLAQRPCIPCRGGVEPLTREQCESYLAEVSDWELDVTAHYIRRHFQFRDYRTALAFANAVSALAEEIWHHPELALGWGFCDVSLTTRKIGGLHESDFVMAARIDALASGPLDSAWLPPLLHRGERNNSGPNPTGSWRILVHAPKGALAVSHPGFAPQNWHQPSGLIGSTTSLQEVGATN
jgi:4a-hydroxytetrahydrobiopterin dehydratase